MVIRRSSSISPPTFDLASQPAERSIDQNITAQIAAQRPTEGCLLSLDAGRLVAVNNFQFNPGAFALRFAHSLWLFRRPAVSRMATIASTQTISAMISQAPDQSGTRYSSKAPNPVVSVAK